MTNTRNGVDLVEKGKETRFGAERGVDPSEVVRNTNLTHNNKKVRLALQRLACAEFRHEERVTLNSLLKKFGPRKTHVVTGAEMIAARKFLQAYEKAETAMMQQITDDIDGKQVQKTIEATATLAELVAGSYGDDSAESGE